MTKLIDIPVKVEVYDALTEWEVNTGEQGRNIPKKITGRFRTLKNYGMAVWLIYFLGPYLRWDGEQAVLFDIPKQQFHLFSITIFPQDIWVLSLLLLFFALLLAVVTTIAGRVFCGYFCFQTVWTEIFTLIEGKLEGDTPSKRHKFTSQAWNTSKVLRKTTKHVLWLLIAILTGLTFSAWFIDAYALWGKVLTLQAPTPVWVAMGVFTFFTYWFAGFMREQVCFWLCPYARLQGVMYDQDTVLPVYDAERGEPRGKLSKQSTAEQGACIDCHVCVAVCPTGIDIRKGQQEGCITCGLCVDACDSIMDKIKQPRGLIRYASHKEIYQNKAAQSLIKRPKVLVYGLIMLTCISGIGYGLMSLPTTEFTVIQSRNPLYTQMSNGDIQNKYTLKLLNKTDAPMEVRYAVSGLKDATVSGIDNHYTVLPGKVVPVTVLIRSPMLESQSKLHDIQFTATAINGEEIEASYDSVFIFP